MANPGHCTNSSCDTVLVPHCESAGCRWLKCPNAVNCDRRIYDLDHGTCLDKFNRLQRLSS
jgi:hypothetical protein